MARGRMLDRVIILSKKINSVSEGAENLYYRLLVMTDDYGRYHADPKILRGVVYPRRKITHAIVKRRLEELFKVGLIRIYEEDSEKYLEITKFEEHQKFRPDRKRRAEFPKPKRFLPFLQGSDGKMDTTGKPLVVNGKPSVVSKLSKDKLSKDNIYPLLFEKFWQEYPRKKEKRVAFDVFNKLKKGEQEQVIICARNYHEEVKNKKIEESYIKHPATFLRKERWRDYLKQKVNPTQKEFDELLEKIESKNKKQK